MLIQPWKMIFFFLIVSGTILSISSSSWMGMWMGLEMNLMGIIPILTSEKNSRFSEASLKYFLVQALSSSLLIFAFLISSMIMTSDMMMILIMMSMMIKSGIAPFHFWIPPVSEGLKYPDLLIILTWQKIAPISVMMYMLPEFNKNILLTSIILSTILGAGGGFNQSSNRKILAYSSIAHSGWMISSMMMSIKIWMIYMTLYSIVLASLINLMTKINMNKITQSMMQNSLKIAMIISVLSLGGMPPLLGFLPKLMVISILPLNNLFLIYIMISSTLVTMYYYLRMSYSMMMHSSNTKTLIKPLPTTMQIMLNAAPILIMPIILLQ